LIDLISVKLNALLIGKGIPMFAGLEQPLQLELVESKIYNSGVALLTYKPPRV